MVRWIYRGLLCAAFLHAGFLFSAPPSPAQWYVGASGAYTQPFFFGLINDIYATSLASFSTGIIVGREAYLVGNHTYGLELFVARSIATEATQPNFVPTFSQQYPAGAMIHYRNIGQTLGVLSFTYHYALTDWLSLAGKLGVGARHLHAEITLETAGAVYNAASPSGAMAIFSAALGFELKSLTWGRIGIFYRSVPPVVYSVSVGTTTVRSADMLAVEWRLMLPE